MLLVQSKIYSVEGLAPITDVSGAEMPTNIAEDEGNIITN